MIDLIQRQTLPAAFSLLPPEMASPASTAMLLAIGLQESRFLHRAQVGGPALGFWQFERGGGTTGVLRHGQTQGHAREVLRALRYGDLADVGAIHSILQHNDVLAAAFARLLLWTLPASLPAQDAPGSAWEQYLAAWRPGNPHRDTWDSFYDEAWTRTRGPRT